MKTSRLKSIVIVILALANAFLLVLLIGQGAQERAARAYTASQLVQLFRTNGVSLSASIVPLESDLFAVVDPARDPSAEAAFAEAVLGPCTAEDVGGGIYRYVGETGQCLFRASGAVEASLERDAEDPETLARELLTAGGYQLVSADLANGSGSISAVRALSETLVFNAGLELVFSQNRLVSVAGSFVPAASVGHTDRGINAVTALVRFLDHSSESGEICTAVTAVHAGYLLESTAALPQQLIPAWRITTDVSQYYVDMRTGEVSGG